MVLTFVPKDSDLHVDMASTDADHFYHVVLSVLKIWKIILLFLFQHYQAHFWDS